MRLRSFGLWWPLLLGTACAQAPAGPADTEHPAPLHADTATTEELLRRHGTPAGELQLLLVAYKASDELELYARHRTDTAFRHLVTYPICARSGTLGPKRVQGDLQVPEGFYHIDRFNPHSAYHLSLGINYPNASDRHRSAGRNTGGDIFIHGNCVTVGCLPMTDPVIERIYALADQARRNGQQRIPVYIFPFRMTSEHMRHYIAQYRDRPDLVAFWEELREGHDRFITTRRPVAFTVAADGRYQFP